MVWQPAPAQSIVRKKGRRGPPSPVLDGLSEATAWVAQEPVTCGGSQCTCPFVLLPASPAPCLPIHATSTKTTVDLSITHGKARSLQQPRGQGSPLPSSRLPELRPARGRGRAAQPWSSSSSPSPVVETQTDEAAAPFYTGAHSSRGLWLSLCKYPGWTTRLANRVGLG